MSSGNVSSSPSIDPPTVNDGGDRTIESPFTPPTPADRSAVTVSRPDVAPRVKTDPMADTLDGSNHQGDPLIGAVVADRYMLIERVGEGGMGAVYRGEHVTLKKRVAVKFLHAELSRSAEIVARFQREAVAAANLEHPNVVAAHDFGKMPDGQFFLVMDFVAGRSLRDEMDASKVLDAPRVLHITKHIAAALTRAHSMEIIHRDLKPENVQLVERDGDNDFARVIDFGIAKVSAGKLSSGPALTQAGMVFGTPEYMAPEQAMGVDVDARADLYALATIVFEMLAGRRPFVSDDVMSLLGQHMASPPPTVSSIAPPEANIPLGLDAVLQKALSKSPRDRYESATAFIEALEGAIVVPVSETPSRLGLSPAAATPSVVMPEGAAPRPSTIGEQIREVATHVARGTRSTLVDIQADPPRRQKALIAGGVTLLAAVVLTFATAPSSRATRRATGRPAVHEANDQRPARTTVLNVPRTRTTNGATQQGGGANTTRTPSATSTASNAVTRDIDAFRARRDVSVLLANLPRSSSQLNVIVSQFEQRAANNPDNALEKHTLGMLYARMGARSQQQMLESYRDALRSRPELAGDAELLGNVLGAIASARRGAPPIADELARGPLARTGGGFAIGQLTAPRATARTRAPWLAMLNNYFGATIDNTDAQIIAIFRAERCEEIRDAVTILRRDGDARALPALASVPVGQRCSGGLFGGCSRVNPCLDGVIQPAVDAIRARTGASTATP